MLIKELLFSLLPRYYQLNDSYKDSNGRGLVQKYSELLGEDFDSFSMQKLLEILANCMDARTAETKFLDYLELNRGILEPFVSTEYFKRKMLQRISTLYKYKGTKLSYEACFNMLGFDTAVVTTGGGLTDNAYYRVYGDEGTYIFAGSGSATQYFSGDYFRAGTGWSVAGVNGNAKAVRQTVVENFNFGGTFDTNGFDESTFDGACDGCSSYTVELWGVGSLDVGVFRDIFRVIRFCEPINARLTAVYYNGIALLDNIITIYIDDNGDLIYINSSDPNMVLTLNADGDLIATGTSASKYNIVTGDMIYTG